MAARKKVSFKDAHLYIEENNESKGPLKVELYKPTNAGDPVKKYGSLEKTENDRPTIDLRVQEETGRFVDIPFTIDTGSVRMCISYSYQFILDQEFKPT
jgi:hypothetical protein